MKSFLSGSSHQESGSFLPQDYISERTDARANILTLTLFAITMAGVVAAFFVTNRHWQSLHRTTQDAINVEYQAEGMKIEQLKSLESQRAAIMEKAEITAAPWRSSRWAMLGELTLRMPASMRLDQFLLKSTRVLPPAPPPTPGSKAKPQSLVKPAADKNDKSKDKLAKKEERPKVEPPKFEYAITIEGTAEVNNDIADFLASVKQSPAFDKVELTFIKDAKEMGKDMRKFQITAALRKVVGTGDLGTSLQDLLRKTSAMNLLKQQEAIDTKPGAAKTASVPEGGKE